ncbi:putative leucine-rich repeat receptor-like serine/threonine-protein kinase At2g19230 [Prosopis cineraria]|uniref:putative leucine-rich repeat receptor-like serine/threonine-protein kinase At2g19230 n=1 Tax=Prosopis cineraria TaxID=364024 RepID=UPI00240F4C92|nr:putative leucine-rich repeat receptor-like serine/threonine-protein kinase At2g19230 [Prosopis cineraria]
MSVILLYEIFIPTHHHSLLLESRTNNLSYPVHFSRFRLSYKLENMKGTLLSILALYVFLVSFINIISHPVQVVADGANSSGVIRIDCGVTKEYWDDNNFYYEADGARFVEFGEIHNVSSKYILTSKDDNRSAQQLNTLRSFPEGERNCYKLKPKQGKNNTYLIRALHFYGNYDNKYSTPEFDLHLGVDYWSHIGLDDSRYSFQGEIIHVAPADTVDVCLANAGRGIPLISLLELYPLPYSLYQPPTPLDLYDRISCGMKGTFSRYSNDPYGRSWFSDTDKAIANSKSISTSTAIKDDSKDYKPPKQVLSTAITSLNASFPLVINVFPRNDYEYHVYLHFFDFEKHPQNQRRSMEINLTDRIRESITLNYKQLLTINKTIPKGSFKAISIISSPGSGLPPMINAYEIYRVLPQPTSPTHERDVDAIWKIKEAYKILRISWQGDPCLRVQYRWEGVTCNYSESIPRIISLDLSSSKLEGDIVTYFSNLMMLASLDLSNNQLTGEIPQLLAKLPKLKVLNLTGNNLKGSIPKALMEKSSTGLTLSLDGNPGLCQTGSCKTTTKKFIVPLVASVAASMATLVIIIYISTVLYKRKRKKQKVLLFKKAGDLKSKNQAFCEDEILRITNNFESVIGEGGFGKVYLGKLQDGTQVAVKLLSKSSQQGFKEFESEAKLLSIVFHRNLVSLVGYCDDGDMRALIYEYMAKGNLRHQLSDKNPCILKWNERLQIALDTAYGLDYLHNGCKPPIIHRDLKSSNILISENMQAKIADFGLSKAFANDTDTHISTRPAGTFGYLDPEFYRFGNLNKKSDVYSFGIILLELMTGRSAINKTPEGTSHIVDWVTPKFEIEDIQSVMDPKLEGNFNTASAQKLLEIALSCVQSTAIKRPDISNVVNDLKQCLALETSLESAESSTILSGTTLFDTSFYQCGSDSPSSIC